MHHSILALNSPVLHFSVHLEMNGTSGSRSPSCSPLVRMKRIYDSGGSNSGNEEEQQQTETAAAKAKITENDETDAAVSDRLHVAADLEGEGRSPSSAGGGEGENESGASSSRPEELLSPENLSGQIESPSLNEDSVGGESTSSSSEAVSTPKSTADRLATLSIMPRVLSVHALVKCTQYVYM